MVCTVCAKYAVLLSRGYRLCDLERRRIQWYPDMKGGMLVNAHAGSKEAESVLAHVSPTKSLKTRRSEAETGEDGENWETIFILQAYRTR